MTNLLVRNIHERDVTRLCVVSFLIEYERVARIVGKSHHYKNKSIYINYKIKLNISTIYKLIQTVRYIVIYRL